MKVTACDNKIILKDVSDFHPVHIFDCGQAFRWNKDEIGYVGVVGDKVVRVITSEDTVIIENTNLEEYEGFWHHYFDFDRDYEELRLEFTQDPILEKAIGYGLGMRILNQDPWETLISFIISANNNMGRIKLIIEKLSASLGSEINWEGRTFYSFPTPEALAQADDALLKACGCGYRGPYIKTTAGMVAEDKEILKELKDRNYEEAHKGLLRFMGVGGKVADCIALFSLEKSEAFPVDVWIKRVMEHLYIGHEVPIKEIKAIALDKFGINAGLAQQYLFYYARELKIGK